METMGSSRNNAKKPIKIDKQGLTPESSAVEENVQAIKRWESAILHARSKAEQVSDWIACTAGSGPVFVIHVVWFGAWLTVKRLTNRMEELAEPADASASTKSDAEAESPRAAAS